MTSGFNHFGPIPEDRDFPETDRLRVWLAEQTVSAQKLITGALQAGQEIESSNFVSGSAGWQIDGDGNAEFNNVTVRGDIESGNWDGTSPADLTSLDGGATAGFYLDSSAGAGQFEGDFFVGGNLQLNGGVVRTDADSVTPRLEVSGTASAQFLAFHGNNSDTLYIGLAGGNLTFDTQTDPAAAGGNQIRLASSSDIVLNLPDPASDDQTVIINNDGSTAPAVPFRVIPGTLPDAGFRVQGANSAAAPAWAFEGDTNTGIYRPATNKISVVGGGVFQFGSGDGTSPGLTVNSGDATRPGVAFNGDLNTGVYRPGADQVAIAAGGGQTVLFTSARNFMVAAADDTTGNAANARINAADGRLQRSTSSLRYKPDWRFVNPLDVVLPEPIKWTDERGQLRLGFGAEHIHQVIPEAYEDEGENYDLRSVVAVNAAKIQSLERWSLVRRFWRFARNLFLDKESA